jgi:hypothetical protein
MFKKTIISIIIILPILSIAQKCQARSGVIFYHLMRFAAETKKYWDRYKPFHVRPSNAEIRIETPQPGQIISGGIVAKCSFWYFEDKINTARFVAGRAFALHPSL